MNWQLPLGAQLREDGVHFRVWAGDAREVEVVIVGPAGASTASNEDTHAVAKLDATSEGYFEGSVPGLRAGTRYMYRLTGDNSKLRPDPASRYQPEGVHGPSQVVDPSFEWTDEDWQGVPLEQLVIYEAHVGTFSTEGTFAALAAKLPYLKALGVTAVEIMPVADFPGGRNWGYDGVDLYAPARAYGGPQELKKLVNSAHATGLGVILDVVYNHLGPDGNYLRDFSAEYFTSEHKTPWGDALNFANVQVREFFVQNALYWAHEYHMDGLRLDATHAILDSSEEHILAELARRVKEMGNASNSEGRHFVMIAEDERNEAWLVTPPEEGGAGLDAVWADDFHHEVRSALAGDNEGYYKDYTGSAHDIALTLDQGWFYTGRRSKNLGRKRGTDASHIDPARFVYCIQNHDQVGNRPMGDRLTGSVDPEAYRAASALLLLSPYTPLLFQGQEWAASTPFLFFTDHEPGLGKQVTEGRRAEFAHFAGFGGEEVPDPQALETFLASKLRWDEVRRDGHHFMLELYHELLQQRRTLLGNTGRTRLGFKSAAITSNAIAMRYSCSGDGDLLVVVNLRGEIDLDLESQEITRPPEGKRWDLALSTDATQFGGPRDLADLERETSEGRITARGPVAVALRNGE